MPLLTQLCYWAVLGCLPVSKYIQITGNFPNMDYEILSVEHMLHMVASPATRNAVCFSVSCLIVYSVDSIVEVIGVFCTTFTLMRGNACNLCWFLATIPTILFSKFCELFLSKLKYKFTPFCLMSISMKQTIQTSFTISSAILFRF